MARLSKAEIAKDEEQDGIHQGQSVTPSRDFYKSPIDYTWLNPHLTLSLDWFGERTSIEATDPAWAKWRPSDPTSPHWYSPRTSSG